MVIVSDTSPISNLLIVGELELLRCLFGEVIIPPEVFQEIQAAIAFGFPGLDLKQTPWIRIANPH